MEYIKNHKLYALGILIGFLIIIVLFAIFGGGEPKAVRVYSSQLLAQNIQYPTQLDDGTIRFFTGSAVADLSLKDLTTKAVTDEYNLPRALVMRWMGTKAVIKFDKVAISTANKESYFTDSSDSSWWLLDSDARSLVPVTSSVPGYDVIDVIWSAQDNQLVVLLQKGNDNKDQKVARYNTSAHHYDSVVGASELSLVADAKQGLIVQRNDQGLLITDAKEQYLGIYFAKKPTLSGSQIIYEPREKKADSTTTSLKYYDLDARKTVDKSVRTESIFAVSKSGVVAFPTNGDLAVKQKSVNTGVVAASSKSNVLINMDDASINTIGVVTTLVSMDKNNPLSKILVTNSTNELYALSSEENISKQVSSYPPLLFASERTFINKTVVRYDGVTNELVFSYYQNKIIKQPDNLLMPSY